MGRIGWIAVWMATAMIGCTSRTDAETPPDQYKEQYYDFPFSPAPKLDVLLVVDTSSSMADEATNLADNMPVIMSAVEERFGCRPSVHVGVVSSDLGTGPHDVPGCTADGDRAAFQRSPRVPGCSAPDGAFLRDVLLDDGTRDTNYDGALSDAVSCVAALGANGCEFQQPLEAMRRALDDSVAGNGGFVREDAAGLVLFVSDGDDCSVDDPSLFDPSQTTIDDPLGPLSSFRCFEFGVECSPDEPRAVGLKDDCAPRVDSPYLAPVEDHADFLFDTYLRWGGAVALVGGDVGEVVVGDSGGGERELFPSCSSAAGSATPPVRLHAFAQAFRGRSTAASICDDDLSGTLEGLFDSVDFGPRCLEAVLVDIDPDTPGVQPECSATEVTQGSNDERVLPRCDNPAAPETSTNQPCYDIAPSQLCPVTPTGLRFERYPSRCFSAQGGHFYLRCVVE